MSKEGKGKAMKDTMFYLQRFDIAGVLFFLIYIGYCLIDEALRKKS